MRAGISYKQRQGKPITPHAIDRLNGLILDVGFKLPALWDPDFKAALASQGGDRNRSRRLASSDDAVDLGQHEGPYLLGVEEIKRGLDGTVA